VLFAKGTYATEYKYYRPYLCIHAYSGMGNAYMLQSENLKGRDPVGNLGVDRKIILKWIFKM
jgi:hypothetical protein